MQTILGALVWLLCGSLCVMGVCLMSMPGTRPPYLNELKLLKQFERLHRFFIQDQATPRTKLLLSAKIEAERVKGFLLRCS